MLSYDEAELEAFFHPEKKIVLLSDRFIVHHSYQLKPLFFKAAVPRNLFADAVKSLTTVFLVQEQNKIDYQSGRGP